ncbi:MAG: cyclopropane fatty acyl phospholipid synthase [Chloroflexi bacterium]|nr:MAG: cyclopropane fatty acyl phospholipid synthase [Chloroflexota bacterium]
MTALEKTVNELLKHADIEIGGSRPHDIQIHNNDLYARVLRDRELGLGESYMDGWWTSERPDQTIVKLLTADLGSKIKPNAAMIASAAATLAKSKLSNSYTLARSKKNAEFHYNIGNDLYELMLDPYMQYTCGYWKGAKNLAQAQENKLKLVCEKLKLKKGMTILEMGCGWGGFSEYAARNYGVKVTAVNTSSEQVKIARERTKGLDVKIVHKDYREVTGQFDRVVSIGMLEHVGLKEYPAFFKQCNELLKPGGIMLHHTIGCNTPQTTASFSWLGKYIFPGGYVPTMFEVLEPAQKYFAIEDVQNIGPDYDKTLLAWHQNFTKNYSKISDKYDEKFYKMWEYYLLMCAAGFRTRNTHLWQFVMTRHEVSERYDAPR